MTGQRCGPRCNDWKLRATEVQAHIEKLEKALKALGAVRPVNAKAEKVGEIANALGLNGKRASALVLLLEPLLIPFLLEWTAIIAVGYGLGHSRSGKLVPVAVNSGQALVEPRPAPPTGPGRRKPVRELSGNRGRKPDPRVIDFSDKFRERHGRSPGGAELMRAFPGMPKSTAYDYAQRVA